MTMPHPLMLDGVTHDTEYLVTVIRFTEKTPHNALTRLRTEHDTVGAMFSPLGDGAVLLAPLRDADRVDHLLSTLTETWTASATRPLAEISAGYGEAMNILALAMASGKPAGRYRLDDVLLEYAVTREPVVCRRLASIIDPLLSNDVLRETLEVLIHNDFNRATSTRDLFIHRSTLDYRIRRIEEVTGYDPMTSRGAHVLTSAMAVRVLYDAA